MSLALPHQAAELHSASAEEARRLLRSPEARQTASSIHRHRGETDNQRTLQSHPGGQAPSPLFPSDDIFASLSNPESDVLGFPSIAECAVHLELLEAYHILREKVLKSNALDITFGTRPEKKYGTRWKYRGTKRKLDRYLLSPPSQHDPSWQLRRQAKWPRFLTLAVIRFELWFEHVAYLQRITDETMPPLGRLQPSPHVHLPRLTDSDW